MSDKVIVFVADDEYAEHYKSLAVNCRNEGQYDGDFLWIVPDDAGDWVHDLRQRGFHAFPVQDRGFLAKFQIFAPYLRQWDQALFMDADCIVQRPLQPLFEQLANWPLESTNRRRVLAMREDVPVFMGWQIWDKEWQSHTEIYEEMGQLYPFVNASLNSDKMWNSAVLLYEPASIPEDTVAQLRALQAKYFVCNDPAKGGTDEPIIDLLLHNHFAQVGEKGWCHWGLDEHNSRVPSLSRGWRGDEIPAILHFTRWYAPWVEKEPDADAYLSHRMGRPYIDIYKENLAKFDATFPLKES